MQAENERYAVKHSDDPPRKVTMLCAQPTSFIIRYHQDTVLKTVWYLAPADTGQQNAHDDNIRRSGSCTHTLIVSLRHSSPAPPINVNTPQIHRAPSPSAVLPPPAETTRTSVRR